MYFCVSL